MMRCYELFHNKLLLMSPRRKECVVKEQFVQCFDSQGGEFLISQQSVGMFYILSQHGAQLKYPVMTISQIMNK